MAEPYKNVRFEALSNNNIAMAGALIRQQLGAQTAELDQVGEGPEACFTHALNKNSSNPDEVRAAQEWAKENGIVLDRLQYFLAIDNTSGQMLGFSGIYSTEPGYLQRTADAMKLPTPNPEFAAKFESRDTFCMGWSAVIDEMKGKGIGSIMMAHSFEIASKIAKDEGIENPNWGILSDAGAISFYERRGLTNVMTHGVEAIFIDPLSVAKEKFAQYSITNQKETNTMTTDFHAQVEELNGQMRAAEAANRTPEQIAILASALGQHGTSVEPNKIKILEDFPGAKAPIAVYQHPDTGKVEAAPIDPIVISFYEYKPSVEEEVTRRKNNPGLRDGVTMSGALQLVDNGQLQDPTIEITVDQLIAIQNLMGNNSTWWPIKDYTQQEVKDVFNALELSVVYKEGVPIGIAHLDKSGLYKDGDLEAKILKENISERSTKVVFIALDPAVNGKGIGREVLNEMMTRAIDGGAAIVGLDTVLHRDCRSDAKTEQLTGKSAGKVYEKAGFKLVGGSLINPGDKAQLEAEGLAINQLNGPTEYVSKDYSKLRSEVYKTFGLDVATTLGKVDAFRDEPKPAPSLKLEGKSAIPLTKTLSEEKKSELATLLAGNQGKGA